VLWVRSIAVELEGETRVAGARSGVREAFGGSARASTSNSQAFHNSRSARRRERMNRVSRSTLDGGVRTNSAEASASFESTRRRPFQDDGSRVRTRALRSAMSVPLAAQSSHAPHSVPADEASTSTDDPFPNCGARGSSRIEPRMSGGFAPGAHSARRARAKLALAHRARNALPQVVRPELEPLPPSTRVRSLRASRTRGTRVHSRAASRIQGARVLAPEASRIPTERSPRAARASGRSARPNGSACSPSRASQVARRDRALGLRSAEATRGEREQLVSFFTVARARLSSSVAFVRAGSRLTCIDRARSSPNPAERGEKMSPSGRAR